MLVVWVYGYEINLIGGFEVEKLVEIFGLD